TFTNRTLTRNPDFVLLPSERGNPLSRFWISVPSCIALRTAEARWRLASVQRDTPLSSACPLSPPSLSTTATHGVDLSAMRACHVITRVPCLPRSREPASGSVRSRFSVRTENVCWPAQSTVAYRTTVPPSAPGTNDAEKATAC